MPTDPSPLKDKIVEIIKGTDYFDKSTAEYDAEWIVALAEQHAKEKVTEALIRMEQQLPNKDYMLNPDFAKEVVSEILSKPQEKVAMWLCHSCGEEHPFGEVHDCKNQAEEKRILKQSPAPYCSCEDGDDPDCSMHNPKPQAEEECRCLTSSSHVVKDGEALLSNGAICPCACHKKDSPYPNRDCDITTCAGYRKDADCPLGNRCPCRCHGKPDSQDKKGEWGPMKFFKAEERHVKEEQEFRRALLDMLGAEPALNPRVQDLRKRFLNP